MWRHPPLDIVVLIKKNIQMRGEGCVCGRMCIRLYCSIIPQLVSSKMLQFIPYYKATLKTVYLTRYKQLLLSSSVL